MAFWPPFINHVFFSTPTVRIRKKANSTLFYEFKPISFCQDSYKIITKIMTNRFVSILAQPISTNQSGFIAGRVITDYILLAQRTFKTSG